jgi:hypothetical protein
MDRIKTLWIVLISMTMALSCKVSERTAGTANMDKVAVDTPKIIFLNYSISEDKTDQEYSIRLINKIITNGKIKENSILPFSPEMDDLEYIISDKNQNVLMRNFIPNPLNKTLEFVDDNGQLAKKDMRLDSSQFSLRIQLDPAAKYILLERYKGPDAENIHLSVVDITKDDQE